MERENGDEITNKSTSNTNTSTATAPQNSTAISVPQQPLNSTAQSSNCRTPNSKISILHSTYHETPENAIKNPFDSDPKTYINRLKSSMFSPSVFENIPESENEDSGDFEWGIEHIALINPADIDDSAVLNQQSGLKLSEAEETAAQNSIQKFFDTCVLPSPSPAKGNRKMMAIFSPSVSAAQFKNKKNVEKTLKTPKTIGNIKVLPVQKLGTVKKPVNRKSVASQTDLRFPFDLDVERIFAEYMTNSSAQESQNMSLGGTSSANTSLRRRLFQDDQDVNSSQGSLDSDVTNQMDSDVTNQVLNVTTPSKYGESPIFLKSSGEKDHFGTPIKFSMEGINEDSSPLNTPPNRSKSNVKSKFELLSPGLSPIGKPK